jgi:hypothetical protein
MYLDDILVRGEDASSIEEQEEISVTVYPNPASHILHIETQYSIEKASIYSVDGLLVKSYIDKSIPVSELENGNYIVKIQTNKGLVIKRFTKI